MMKAKLIFLLKYYLFWVVISIVAKIMFLFYQWSDTTHLSAADFWHILAGGIRLDLSLSGYILMLSSVILICSVFVGEKIIRAVTYYYDVLHPHGIFWNYLRTGDSTSIRLR